MKVVLQNLFGVTAPTHRSGTSVTREDRNWLIEEVRHIVSGALARARGKKGKKINKIATDVYSEVLTKAVQVYMSPAKLREVAYGAQAAFLSNIVRAA